MSAAVGSRPSNSRIQCSCNSGGMRKTWTRPLPAELICPCRGSRLRRAAIAAPGRFARLFIARLLSGLGAIEFGNPLQRLDVPPQRQLREGLADVHVAPRPRLCDVPGVTAFERAPADPAVRGNLIQRRPDQRTVD